jgi:hypothetical protein
MDGAAQAVQGGRAGLACPCDDGGAQLGQLWQELELGLCSIPGHGGGALRA